MKFLILNYRSKMKINNMIIIKKIIMKFLILNYRSKMKINNMIIIKIQNNKLECKKIEMMVKTFRIIELTYRMNASRMKVILYRFYRW